MDQGPQQNQEFWIRVGIVALLGGGVTNIGWHATGLGRPDPFTGSEGKDLEMRCETRSNRLEKRIDQLTLYCRELEGELHQHTSRGEAGYLKLNTLWEYHLRRTQPQTRDNFQNWREQRKETDPTR